ncbi:aldehyde dehydrogenase family protein [Acuticoccus kandeliae]|uniref:aldehyde dehydrogenase family protein n=1 Tax=Acuticoccus kandeliae TaxID=2073160 RepID=UPI000D3E9039|nr:aldehyde dehydrogenase family protein [Acuticoccus kandeliae]
MSTLTDTIAPGALWDGRRLTEGRRHEVLDKFTRQPIGEIVETSSDEIAAIVASLADAIAEGEPDAADRADILARAADLVEAARPRFVPLLLAEAGFSQAEAAAEVTRAVATLRLSAEETRRINGELIPFGAVRGQENRIGFTVRAPLGVVCAITPFNSPLNTVLHKVAPAFGAGNAVVLKPAIATPLTASLLVDLLLEAGWPPRLLALVQGPGSVVGNALLAQPGIDYFAFTGSTAVGRHIQANAGLRRTQMELGSIASVIVAADADLDKAAAKSVAAGFRKAGQVCTSVQVMHIERAIMDEMTDRILARIDAIVPGDPREAATTMGPLISLTDAERVENWIGEAVNGGAKAVRNGARDGALLAPSLLHDVDSSARVLTEEVFGPVISLVPFDTLDTAVARANATPYGLAAGLFCGDLSRALSAARKMRFGGVHIGEASSARSDGMPFGGVKDSGFGREGPAYAMAEMSEERLITLNP